MPSWKKVIVSGSDASLSSLTTSGNVSGSSESTGSFGKLLGDGSDLSGLLGTSAIERGIIIGDGTILDITFITSETDSDVILEQET